MYEPPIRLLVQQVETSLREQQDKQIFEAIQKFGVDVDRDELIKALAYDREQYDKGYADGRADAQRWISVEERLPEDQRSILTVNGHGEIRIMGFFGKRGELWTWLHLGHLMHYNDITHWMPLPKPPKEE